MGSLNIPTGDPAVKAPIVVDEVVTVREMARFSLMVMVTAPSDVVTLDMVVIDEEGTVVEIVVVDVVTGKGVVDVAVHMEENVAIPLVMVVTGRREAVVDIAEVMRTMAVEVKAVAVVRVFHTDREMAFTKMLAGSYRSQRPESRGAPPAVAAVPQ